MDARWIELSCGRASCRCPPARERGSALRLLTGRLGVPAVPLPDVCAAAFPGRVVGAGRFRAHDVAAAIAGALPTGLAPALHEEFEWYACRGAFFHNDAHYGDVLFGAWCVAGPPREIVFARANVCAPAAPGDWAVFDPFEPHAVLDAGQRRYMRDRYLAAEPSVFIGFELMTNEATCSLFGIGPSTPGLPILASGIAVNAETGSIG